MSDVLRYTIMQSIALLFIWSFALLLSVSNSDAVEPFEDGKCKFKLTKLDIEM